MEEQKTMFTVNVNGTLEGAPYNKTRYYFARTRRIAVRQTIAWFWREYAESIGPAHKTLTIDDPLCEVHYHPRFQCNCNHARYLDSQTIARVIEESKGVLMLDTRKGSLHHPPNSVRRKKRRPFTLTVVAPGLRQSNTGVFYLRCTIVPFKVRDGVVIQNRKLKDVRLSACTLAGALAEAKELKKARGGEVREVCNRIKARVLAAKKRGPKCQPRGNVRPAHLSDYCEGLRQTALLKYNLPH